jgi:hypothetical protein
MPDGSPKRLPTPDINVGGRRFCPEKTVRRYLAQFREPGRPQERKPLPAGPPLGGPVRHDPRHTLTEPWRNSRSGKADRPAGRLDYLSASEREAPLRGAGPVSPVRGRWRSRAATTPSHPLTVRQELFHDDGQTFERRRCGGRSAPSYVEVGSHEHASGL